MDNNFLSAFSFWVALISSLVAITVVTICSVLTAVISQRGARKVKQTELFFHEMVSAYHDYLMVSSSFSNLYDTAQISEFTNAYDRAMLFASKNTKQFILSDYKLLVKILNAKDKHSEDLNSLALEASVIREKLLESMQKDLRK